ncbi:hypothetical protein KCP71_19240 [Salmonella enterica subsp. enterica]|nr:hypothetical protein KCP71_19240 [Salmonella enterica subsp. enterica]
MIHATIYPSHYPERRRDGDDRDDHLVGFEPLMAQELQFVFTGYRP